MLSTEQTLQLQLTVSETLTQHTTREGIGLALAEVINKLVPFEYFLHSIWSPNLPLGYRINSRKNDDGKFEIFRDVELFELMAVNPEAFQRSALFLTKTENAGVYQGRALTSLAAEYPSFKLGYDHYGVRSIMIFSMTHSNGYNNVFIISDRKENSFSENIFQTISKLLPQIKLAFDNLFKYEELRQQEQDRKLQLMILTACSTFDNTKTLDEMAVDAIGHLDEFVPFDFWFTITKDPPEKNRFFRIVVNTRDGMINYNGNDVFKKINHPVIEPGFFKDQNPELFKDPQVFVGDDLCDLMVHSSYIKALQENLGLNSLLTVPVTVMGRKDTLFMLGCTRKYAYTLNDLQSVVRALPHFSMGAQQFYFLFHIQALTKKLQLEKNYLEEEIKLSYNFDEIVGTSNAMQDVFKQISQVAPTDSTALILGETGTGKELIARAIHNQSPRKGAVLIKVNCASLPSQLIESELFGHEKGSFTGALEKRIGKFELANGGTIFLDEIGELPLELQAKLLRVLQEREIERIGGTTTISLDVRIIAATNRDLDVEVSEGRFRSDLYYRLNVFPIYLPPLRERKEDIPTLIDHFMAKFSKKMKKNVRSLNINSVQELIQYPWPGNIRELENVIEQTVIVGEESFSKLRKTAIGSKVFGATAAKSGKIGESSHDENIINTLVQTKGKVLGEDGAARLLNLRPAEIERHERMWILDALKKTEGRIRGKFGAANLIGLNPTTLEARVKKLKITKAEIFNR